MIRLLTFIFLLIFPLPVFAQFDPPDSSTGKEGEIVSQPICSAIVNRSDQTMLGTLSTAGQRIASGEIVKNQDNFRMKPGERKEFCSTGPFFAGQRLEIVLRTILPLFDCKTKIDHEIYLDALPDENGVKHLFASCD